MYNKLEVFKTELEQVKNSEIRGFAEKVIEHIPDYFFETAASSTGKYHSRYVLENGGLVRHTKAAVGIAIGLLSLEHNTKRFSSDERDCIIVSLICHDGWKHGDTYNQYTVASHPVVAAEHILELSDENEKDFAKAIADNIRSHMGEWNTDYKTKEEIMPKPQSSTQIFVHECDYLASRKHLIYEFDEYYDPKKYEVQEQNGTELKVAELIALCKDKISKGVDRDRIYAIIAEKNNGKKNPNTITETSVVNEIIKIISAMKEGE